MTVQIAMFLLTISATATSLITEAIKKTFGAKAPNITAFIVSIIVGALIPIGYLIINSISPTTADAVYIVAMVVLTWLCATLGFDKVKQAIEQMIDYVNGMELKEGDIVVTKTKGHTGIITDVSSTAKKGSKGEDVKWVQRQLTYAGYDLSKHGGIDGDFGDFTEKCVKDFQTKHCLEPNGVVGEKTHAELAKIEKPESSLRFGVDVAKWQGVIDWAKVKTSGQGDFAVLKCTKKNNQIEDSFARNYAGTKAQNIPIAVYRYVYAKSVGQAVEEANGIISVLRDRQIEGEVWLDMEDSSIRNIGKAALTVIIDTEADILKAHGYKVGIYCNTDWYYHVLDGAQLATRYKFWIAKFGKNTGNGSWKDRADDPKDIAVAWQYTSKGRVDGIQGDVDLDLIY